MKFCKIMGIIGAVIFSIMLSACSKDVAPGTYDASEVGKIKKVVSGVILSKRPVNIQNHSADSASTDANKVADSVDNSAGHNTGVEYVIKLNSGSIVSVVQVEDLDLKAKQHVLVIYGENTRVVADDGSND